jgi:hypothetical protein
MQLAAEGDRRKKGWGDLRALANAANAAGDSKSRRYYSAFFRGFKRVGRMNTQASMTARLKNGASNHPSTSSFMASS